MCEKCEKDPNSGTRCNGPSALVSRTLGEVYKVLEEFVDVINIDDLTEETLNQLDDLLELGRDCIVIGKRGMQLVSYIKHNEDYKDVRKQGVASEYQYLTDRITELKENNKEFFEVEEGETK